MTAPTRIDAATLLKLDRIGNLALAPDGSTAVCSVSSMSLPANKASTSLWLLPTHQQAARRLTRCGDKDGQPAWSPRGDRIAFIARRDQEGGKDQAPQLYVIAADGGEAERVSNFGPGVEAFKWMPDGRRIVFAAWVWPGLRGSRAQDRQHKAFSTRKDSGYVTSEANYRFFDKNLPMGRVVHLLMLDIRSGRITDLFEATPYELTRRSPGSNQFDIAPDGSRIAFTHDPAARKLPGQPQALAELDLTSGRTTALTGDAEWNFDAPRYSPDGQQLACIAAHVGHLHTMPGRVALLRRGQPWQALAQAWDGHVDAPLRWAAAGDALLFTAEQRGRRPLWHLDLASQACTVVVPGGWVQGFDLAGAPGAETLVVAADSAVHPVRVLAQRAGGVPRRLERFNDKLLAPLKLRAPQEVTLRGALGEPVQMWLTFPPGFDPAKTHPLLHVVHGGPHVAAGDTFGYRWNSHLLASQGHVVAQVNYHGSSGFGHAFRHSIMGRQGQLEMIDIEAGTDWLLAQPWADSRRVFLAGGSYGGYMAAWMNGHVAPGRYQAYVCHAGVFDRVATFSADSYMQRPKDLGALYWEDAERVRAQSPCSFAQHMDTPTLVIHGALDYRVPDCNGLAYYNTLQSRGVDSRLLWFPDENHWVLKPQNTRLWYAEIFAWLAAHDPRRQPPR
ncbi:MAG: S9 family peptidase [Rubrivivax sp.]|nr:S9 family peptidase [Rubrivivax sp.]